MDYESQLKAIQKASGVDMALQSHSNGDAPVLAPVTSQEQDNVYQQANCSQIPLGLARDLASYLVAQQAGAVATGVAQLCTESQTVLYNQAGQSHWLGQQPGAPAHWVEHQAQLERMTAEADEKPEKSKILSDGLTKISTLTGSALVIRNVIATASPTDSAVKEVTSAVVAASSDIITTIAPVSISAGPEQVSSYSRNRATTMDPDKAKICAHPSYPRLVLAYTNCQKVGAPPEIVTRMDEIGRTYENLQSLTSHVNVGQEPELDQFMDAYCDILHRCHGELTNPFKEAMSFIRKVELQLTALSKGIGSWKVSKTDDNGGGVGGTATSEDEESCGELDFNAESDVAADVRMIMMMQQQQQQEKQDEEGLGVDMGVGMGVMIDPLAEDHKIKEELMRRYRSCIGSLKQEFLKKKKKGKLQKDARDKLFNWWTQHYKWPYPSEAEKAALMKTTGLEQKQINNWFINQRKRHWKPFDDIHLVMIDGSGPSGHHPCYPENAQEQVLAAVGATESAVEPFNATKSQPRHMVTPHQYHHHPHSAILSFSQQGVGSVKPVDPASEVSLSMDSSFIP